jgi:hypothetical protein
MDQNALDKKKGVPDIVFLLDATGSMTPCIQAVTHNISTFIDTLNTPDANGGVLVKDWRIRIMGYRDRDYDGAQWLVENPFSTDAASVKFQLESLKAAGGGDEPESLLDALYLVAQWPAAEKGATPEVNGWRHRHDAARIVVIFTDASSKNTFKAADGATGTVDDVIQACHAARLKVVLFAPEAPVYSDLSAMNGLEWEPVGTLGNKPQQALADFTANSANFRKVMEALAKTVSASAAAPPAL